jgi:hypothetical protein
MSYRANLPKRSPVPNAKRVMPKYSVILRLPDASEEKVHIIESDGGLHIVMMTLKAWYPAAIKILVLKVELINEADL